MRGEEPIDDIDDSIIFTHNIDRKAVFIDKEVLLARLSDIRSRRKERIVDRFFYLSRQQAYYHTDVYVLAEVLATVRSGTSAQEAVDFVDDIKNSKIRVFHGTDLWDTCELEQSPKEVVEATIALIRNSRSHDIKFDEAALVLQAMATDHGCVFSLDSAIRKLARSYDLGGFPHSDNCW